MAFDPFVTPVDYILLTGLRSPGIARVSGTTRRKVDVRGAYGISATIAVWLEVATPKVELELYTAEDWADFWSWKRAALREMKPNKRNKASDFATDITHPLLNGFDIRSVIVTSVTIPEESDQTGVWKVVIEFIEYREAKLTLSKPDAPKDKPKDDIDRRIDANRAEIERKSQELAQ